MKKLLFIVFAAVIFSGCSKDDDTTATASLDVTLANVAGNYKVTAATVASGGTNIDIFNNNTFFEACDRDDIYTFTSTGTYTLTDAGTVCSPANSDAGTYSVNTTAKTMTIDTETFTVVSLTSTKMVLQQANFMSTGFTGTVTFTKQ